MQKRKNGTLFYCFSPPVMILTFTIEIGLAVYTLWRYKFTTVTKLVVAMLLFLSLFQLSEYMLCGGLGLQGVDWIRFGYASITILPPIGLHLVAALAKKRIKWLIALSYVSSAIFIYFFIFVTKSLNGNTCMPNYAVFHVQQDLTDFFTSYYYGWLAITVSLALWWSRKSKLKRQLISVAIGYSVFIIPTTLVNFINPNTVEGIPSIMCGFAVLNAFALVLGVMPGSSPLKKRSV